MCQCAQVLPPRPNERAGRGRISDLMIVRAPFVPVRPSATAPAKRTGRPRPHLLPITPVLDGLPSRRDFLRPQPHKKRQPLGPEIVKGRPSSRLLFRYFCTGGASRE